MYPVQSKVVLMATLKDVAKKAGVSIATVSRFVNNVGYISPGIQEKIKKAIEELNYTPNIIARSLKSKRSKTIGLIFPEIKDPFFSYLATKAEDVAHGSGYSVILCNTEYNPEKEQMYIEVLRDRFIDGYLIIPWSSDDCKHYSILKDDKKVFVDRSSGLKKEILYKSTISRVLCWEWSI